MSSGAILYIKHQILLSILLSNPKSSGFPPSLTIPYYEGQFSFSSYLMVCHSRGWGGWDMESGDK